MKWTKIIFIELIFFSRTYEFVEKSQEVVTWKMDWSSTFYLDVKTSSFTRQDEFYAYDIWDLTSGLGGLMGLFIGWSFLSIFFSFIDLFRKMFDMCNRENK